MSGGAAKEEDILEGKIFAILSYLSIFCIIPLLFKKNNDFVLSHGRQGLVLFISEVAVFILSIIIPMIFRPCAFLIGLFSLWGMIEALRGRYVRLPFVVDIAEKITL